MEEIKLRVGWYTKAVLTVIALALCWFSVKPLFTAKEVSAQAGTVAVNIVEIQGRSVRSGWQSLPVEITNWP